MKRFLVILFLTMPGLTWSQSVGYAIFGNAADTSSAVVIGQDDLFAGLLIPDDVDSDTLYFLGSRDGTNYYPIQDNDPDSTKLYYVLVDTTQKSFVPLDANVFWSFRRLKIVADDVTSASNDTVDVVYKSRKSWWRF